MGVLLAVQATASAHKLQLYAEPTGAVIDGEAYFQGGGRPRNVEVLIRAPDGKELGRVRTDDQGRFSFRASVRCDHTFVVDSGDGHMVMCTVQAGELPAELPAPGGAAPATRAVEHGAGQGETPASTAPASVGRASAPAATAGAVEEAVLQRIVSRAVRRELDAHEQRVRIRDAVAGIGYIFGLAGVAALVRRRGSPRPPAGGA